MLPEMLCPTTVYSEIAYIGAFAPLIINSSIVTQPIIGYLIIIIIVIISFGINKVTTLYYIYCTVVSLPFQIEIFPVNKVTTWKMTSRVGLFFKLIKMTPVLFQKKMPLKGPKGNHTQANFFDNVSGQQHN